MARIKHLAIVTLDPERLAKFYTEVLGMKVLDRPSTGPEIYLTDGYITLALLKNKAQGKPSGLNHFGVEIDDQEEMAARMVAFGMEPPVERPADRPYAETRATDPDGNNFDLSVHGFQTAETKADRGAKQKPKAAVDA